MPFGVGQFQNGQTALGWTFLATESLLVVGSAISQLLTIYNVNQMNDAITSGSSTAGGYHARAQDAYVATDLFTAGFAVVAHRRDHPRAVHVRARARRDPPAPAAAALARADAAAAAFARRARRGGGDGRAGGAAALGP